MEKYGGWTMFAKFFDNMDPLPHHLHLDDEKAARSRTEGKTRRVLFSSPIEQPRGIFSLYFFGLNPGITRDDILQCLKNWDKGDNGIFIPFSSL